MVEGCATLQMKMKANNVILTMQTNGHEFEFYYLYLFDKN